MNNKNGSVRVRFAPSPTGHLHIGGLRTALFNWLFARHHGGTFLLRIEDTDLERSKQEYVDSILASLAWTGIESDEPPIIQSHRLEAHQQVIEQLLAQGKAYRCFCTLDEVGYRQKMIEEENETFFTKYDGRCRLLQPNDIDVQKPHAIRFKIPHDRKQVVFDDLIRGRVIFELDQFDDFIIARSDGRPIYNFVVVVDDAYMRITHIVRGEEHISNTPKQILLNEACGYAIPYYAHLPMILGPSGNKLSKRDGAVSVLEYKNDGYLPDALINYLVRLGWSHGDQEIFTHQELINYFSLEQVSKKGAIFDPQKLAWVNSVYIRHTQNQDLFLYIRALYPDLIACVSSWEEEIIFNLIALYKERVKTLKELVHELCIVHDGPQKFNEQDYAQWIGKDTKVHLQQIIGLLEQHKTASVDVLAQDIKQLSKQLNIKLVALAQPMRIALIGKSDGPGVFELLHAIGIDESIRRINFLIATVIDKKNK